MKPIEISGPAYAAVVPDTLDLAERARLALHGLAGSTDPQCYYQQWFSTALACGRQVHGHNAADVTCTPKFAMAFPLLRLACGSRDHLELEQRQMEHLLADISPDDGLHYAVWRDDRPWHATYFPAVNNSQEDWCWAGSVGPMMRAMLAWRERDGDPAWDARLQAMARGAAKMAICKDDYAYFPDAGRSGHQFAYPRTGWLTTREPERDDESVEGSVLDTISRPIYALTRWYEASGDTAALELARKFLNCTLKPKLWGGLAEEISVRGAEQGHFHSHPHAHLLCLCGLLAYGRATQHDRVLEFVRRSYEHARTYMIPRLGWIPDNGVGDVLGGKSEACSLADLVNLGIRLSDAGLGDYWDDVDSVVRNLLAESQFTSTKVLRDLSERCPQTAADPVWPGQNSFENMPEALVGNFASFAGGNHLAAAHGTIGCCTGNASLGIYYAWEGALRCRGEDAQVNLLLNRASALADVDSYLPYAGKVVIRNKRARRISVRILSWINRRELRLTVAGQPRSLRWVGNYVLIDELKPAEEIVLTFPMVESTVTYTAHHKVWRKERQYTYVFRGSTAVDVTPTETAPSAIPIYSHPELRRDEAPLKQVTRFVAERVIESW